MRFTMYAPWLSSEVACSSAEQYVKKAFEGAEFD